MNAQDLNNFKETVNKDEIKASQNLNNTYEEVIQNSKIYYDLNIDKSLYDAEELLREGEEEYENQERLMHEVQSISLFQIYFHFFEPIDYLFLVLAIIGSITSGIVTPIIFCLSSENFNNIGNTSEISSIDAPPHIFK